jgi:uncharacterized membrane protein
VFGQADGVTRQPSTRTSVLPRLSWGARGVAAAFAVSGAIHLARPAVFRRLVPRALPYPREVVWVSGAAEVVCAVGLLTRRRWAPRASALLLLLVWPGNWYFAVEMQRRDGAGAMARAVAWVRVPLQIPMIRAVLRSGRPSPPEEPGSSD